VVLGLVPRAPQLGAGVETVGEEEHVSGVHSSARVTRSNSGLGPSPSGAARRAAAVDRQHHRDRGGARRALRVEVEVAELADLVAPELEAHRLGHAEAVDVEDAAAHRVLPDVVDERDALEAHAGEVGGEVLGAPHVAAAQLEPRLLHGARELRALEHRARRGEEDLHVAARQPLERLDALAGDLGVRLGLAERLAVRVERGLGPPPTASRSASQRSASGTPAVSTTNSRCGWRRASAASTTASLDP
jgi:hypothetical protein